jgi:hypothetical protein
MDGLVLVRPGDARQAIGGNGFACGGRLSGLDFGGLDFGGLRRDAAAEASHRGGSDGGGGSRF